MIGRGDDKTMKWELFRADCNLCDKKENMIRKSFPLVNLEVHRASEKFRLESENYTKNKCLSCHAYLRTTP